MHPQRGRIGRARADRVQTRGSDLRVLEVKQKTIASLASGRVEATTAGHSQALRHRSGKSRPRKTSFLRIRGARSLCSLTLSPLEFGAEDVEECAFGVQQSHLEI